MAVCRPDQTPRARSTSPRTCVWTGSRRVPQRAVPSASPAPAPGQGKSQENGDACPGTAFPGKQSGAAGSGAASPAHGNSAPWLSHPHALPAAASSHGKQRCRSCSRQKSTLCSSQSYRCADLCKQSGETAFPSWG